MTDLTEIVARAIRTAGVPNSYGGGTYPVDVFRQDAEANIIAWCKFAAVDALTALRDPPAYVIEAGARAMHDALPYFKPWDHHYDETREIFRKAWLASWRAALNAT